MLPASATREQIKSRYRDLARKFHPDVNGGDERSHARFRAIHAAAERLLAADAETPEPDENLQVAFEIGGKDRDVYDGDMMAREHTPPRGSGDRLTRRRTEARARLDRSTGMMHRAQAAVRDADAKATAARRHGNEELARHFERRVEADRSRAYALLGEISALEQELRGLEARPGDPDREVQLPRTLESKSDPLEQVTREVQNMHDEERAALKRKYKNSGQRR